MLEVNYDPRELVALHFKSYVPGAPDSEQYSSQKNEFLFNLFIKKRQGLLDSGGERVIPSREIARRGSWNSQEVAAQQWLAQIDAVLLKIGLKLGKFKFLIEFLQNNDKLYFEEGYDLGCFVRDLARVGAKEKVRGRLLGEVYHKMGDAEKAVASLLGANSEKPSKKIYARVFQIMKEASGEPSYVRILEKYFHQLVAHGLEQFLRTIRYDKDQIERVLHFVAQIADEPIRRRIQNLVLSHNVDFEAEVANQKINDLYLRVLLTDEARQAEPVFLTTVLNFVLNPKRQIDNHAAHKAFALFKAKIGDHARPDGEIASLLLRIETTMLKRVNTPKSHQLALGLILRHPSDAPALAEDYCSSPNPFVPPNASYRPFLLNMLLDSYIKSYKGEQGV